MGTSTCVNMNVDDPNRVNVNRLIWTKMTEIDFTAWDNGMSRRELHGEKSE